MRRITVKQWALLALYMAVLTGCAGVVFNENIGEGMAAYLLRVVIAVAVVAGLWMVYDHCGVWRGIAENIDE